MTTGIAPDGRPVAFHDLPADHFPFTMTAYAPDGSVVWEETVKEAPVILEIPGTGPGSVERVEVRYANGEVHSN